MWVGRRQWRRCRRERVVVECGDANDVVGRCQGYGAAMAHAGHFGRGGIGNWTAAADGGDSVGVGHQYAAVVEGGVIPGDAAGRLSFLSLSCRIPVAFLSDCCKRFGWMGARTLAPGLTWAGY